jgi:hypothetical protein
MGLLRKDSATPARTSTNQQNKAQAIPPHQRKRILRKYIAGKSIIAISKEEIRNRETVGRIVHGSEMKEYVRAKREHVTERRFVSTKGYSRPILAWRAKVIAFCGESHTASYGPDPKRLKNPTE